MLHRTMPHAPPTIDLTESEIRGLDHLVRDPVGEGR
jgi:hypothetical protein